MKKVRFSRIKQLQAEVERLSANLCTAVKERDENVTIYQTNLAAKDKQLAEANKKLSDANRLRLTEEIMDLLTVLLLVERRTDDMFKPSDLLLETHAIEKIEKIEKYLKYSQSLGEVGNE